MSMEENLRKYIDELIQEVEQELDEATTTAGVDGYQTPFAFGGGRDKDKKKQKRNIDVTGYTKVKDIDESVNEGPMDRIFGGIPYTKKGKQSIVTMKLPDDVKERIIQRAKKEGKVAKPNNGGGVTVFESVNEAKVKRPVNRWLELKNDDTMHPHKKMAHGLKELKYQLAETEKFFTWYNKIKTMNELESSNYWKRTQSHIYKIKERLVNIARTIQEIEK